MSTTATRPRRVAPAPEAMPPPVVRPRRRRRPAPGRGASSSLTGPVTLVIAGGLLVQAWAAARGRGGDDGPVTQWLFWVGLLLVFVPAAARILSRTAAPNERYVLSVVMPLALQLGRAVLYPTQFVYHDELAHANTLRMIQTSHHLFGYNSLLPVSSNYPGLEIATDAIEQLTGLSARAAALVVLATARIVLTLSIVGLAAKLTGSARIACMAGLIYTCNPQAVYFNSQYSYQSLALPLAAFTLYALVSRDRAGRLWRVMPLPVVALLAVVISHHLTSMLLVLAIGAWLFIDLVISRRRPRGDRGALGVLFGSGLVAIVAWAAVPGNPVLGYLRTIATSSVTTVRDRLSGHASRHLFQNANGLASPPWERVALIASIVIVLLAVLPTFALLRWWLVSRQAVFVLLGLTALLYPIIPLGHITPGTGEVTDRASGFLFLGIGLAVALGPGLRQVARRIRYRAVLVGLFTVVFVGGVILGGGPTVAQLPGPYLVSADARSMDRYNLAAAEWERAHLAGARVYADRDSGLLAAAIGGMYVVTHIGDDIDASPILLAPTFTEVDRSLIRRARIDYVVVDERDSRTLPNLGVYIESGEYGGTNRTRPVSAEALHKLAHVPGVQRIYDNGAIAIYDVRALQA